MHARCDGEDTLILRERLNVLSRKWVDLDTKPHDVPVQNDHDSSRVRYVCPGASAPCCDVTPVASLVLWNCLRGP